MAQSTPLQRYHWSHWMSSAIVRRDESGALRNSAWMSSSSSNTVNALRARWLARLVEGTRHRKCRGCGECGECGECVGVCRECWECEERGGRCGTCRYTCSLARIQTCAVATRLLAVTVHAQRGKNSAATWTRDVRTLDITPSIPSMTLPYEILILRGVTPRHEF